MIEISLHRGSREPFASLFSEADDSESQIASYRDLGDLLVAIEAGHVLGHALLVETEEPGIVELKSLAVREERRSQGIGAALLASAIAYCRGSEARKIQVATAAASIDALKFYQRHGFRIQRVIRDFYSSERGYRPLKLNGIPLLDEVILDLDL